MNAVIRVVLPAHLKALAHVSSEIVLNAGPAATTAALLDAVEEQYPVLRSTMRDPMSGRRRAFVRFFACGEDLSHVPADVPLPDAVLRGEQRFLVVGAMAGG